MALKDDIALMARLPIFEGLEDDHLRLIAFGAERRSLVPGQVLYYENTLADCAYVVIRGTLQLSAVARDGETIDQGSAGPGTMLGELAMIMATQRQTTATADEECEVLRITRALFHRMLEEYPGVGALVERRLRKRFSDMAASIAGLAGRFQE